VSTWVEAACVIVVVYAGRLVMEVRYFVSAGKVCVTTIVGPGSDSVTIQVGAAKTVVRVRESMLVVTVK
jgi:hypothetical protein